MNRPISHPPASRRAFTLLEILVVIVIIGILSTLLVLGIKVLGTSAKRQQTQGQFQQLRSFYAEYNALARLRFSPAVMPCPQDVSVDLNPAPPPSPTIQADDGTIANRYGAAVWLTRDLMSNLRPLAAAGAALNKIAPGSRLIVPVGYNSNFPAPYGGNVVTWDPNKGYFAFGIDPSTAISTTAISASDYGRVWRDPNATGLKTYYVCIQKVSSNVDGNLAPEVDHAHWMPAYPSMPSAASAVPDDTVPVLLDGWGNPIIFVSGGTLATKLGLAAGGSVSPNSGAMLTGSGNSAVSVQASSPNNLPFFASAGPDGNFSFGDDNLYAFE